MSNTKLNRNEIIPSSAILLYQNRTSNMGTLVNRFSYDLGVDRFGHRDDTRNMPLGFSNHYALFDKLNEWMIDYRGLIDKKLAVSVFDLIDNPYK